MFILSNLLLTFYYPDIWVTPNAASRAATVLSLYENKSLIIDKYKDAAGDVSFINGHYYANKAPLTSLFIYPFYAGFKSAGIPELKDSTLKKYPIYIWEDAGFPDGRAYLLPKITPVLLIGDFFCSVIPFVLTLFLTLKVIKRTSDSLSPVAVVMLSFYACFLFAYSATLTGHLLSGILVLGGFILIKNKKHLLSGLLVGLAIATEYPVGIVFPVWLLLIWLNEKKWKSMLLFTIGILPGIVIVLYYNYILTGHLTSTPYNYETHQNKENANDIGFNFPKLSALWGLVFTTYRGLLFYVPATIIMCWYLIKLFLKKTFKDISALFNTSIKSYFFMTILTYLLLYSAYYQWWGGWTFGPRYLIPMILVIMYEGVRFLCSQKISSWLFYAVTIAGLFMLWLDKATKIYMISDNPNLYGKPYFSILNVILPDFMKHKYNTNTIPTLFFDASPAFSIYLWLFLFIAAITGLSLWYDKLFPRPAAKIAELKPKVKK